MKERKNSLNVEKKKYCLWMGLLWRVAEPLCALEVFYDPTCFQIAMTRSKTYVPGVV